MSKKKKDETKEEGLSDDLKKTIESDKAINKFLEGDAFLNDMLGIELKPVTLSSLAMMQERFC